MKRNYDSFDLLKFFLSLLVLAIHTFFLQDAIYPWARMTIPAYLILTGFFVFNKLNDLPDEREKKKAVWRSIKRYLLLYIIWFAIHLPVVDWTRLGYGRVSLRHFAFNVVHHFFMEETFRGSWYLMACILGIPSVYYLFHKFSERAAWSIAIILYIVISLYAMFNGMLVRWSSTAALRRVIETVFIDPETTFLIAIPYLSLGKRIAENRNRLRNRKQYLAGLLICLLTLYIEYLLMQKYKIGGFGRTCYLMLAPASYLFVVSVLQLNLHIKKAHLFRLSSTIIYFFHIPAMEMVYVLCRSYDWYQKDTQNMILFITTAVFCMLVSILINRLEKYRFFRFLRYLH